MTNEEAIKIIEVAKAECEWNAPLEYQEAFDAAIDALEKQIPKPSVQPVDKDINVPINVNDCISRQAAMQPTLYGYPVEHLVLIARVLQKENFPPERIAEMLSDVGRIVEMVRDEFEETLRKAVEQCMMT